MKTLKLRNEQNGDIITIKIPRWWATKDGIYTRDSFGNWLLYPQSKYTLLEVE